MIRKVINSDGTFGGNYDTRLANFYKSRGFYPEYDYIEVTTEQANIIDSNVELYRYSAGVPGIFNGKPAGVIQVSDAILLKEAKTAKLAEVISAYDYANQYYVLNVAEALYANVAWIPTWQKVITLCEASSVDVVPSAVRYYTKAPADKKFKNTYVSDMKVSTLKTQLLALMNVQFKILQPKRQKFYEMIESADTTYQLEEMELNFGVTINEQDASDLASKVELA